MPEPPFKSVRDTDIVRSEGHRPLDGNPECRWQCRGDDGPGGDRLSRSADRPTLRVDRLRHRALLGLVAWLVIVPEVRPVDWATHATNR